MRKKNITQRALQLVLVFILLVFPAGAFVGTVLKMNHQFPPTTTGSKIDQWFADQIRTATNNEIDIRIF